MLVLHDIIFIGLYNDWNCYISAANSVMNCASVV